MKKDSREMHFCSGEKKYFWIVHTFKTSSQKQAWSKKENTISGHCIFLLGVVTFRPISLQEPCFLKVS